MEKLIHKISKQGIEAAQSHAQAVERHGREIEAIGVRLKTRSNLPHYTKASIQTAGEWIEGLGQAVQGQGRSSLEYAKALQRSDGQSLADYQASIQAHVEATQLHVQATKVILELAKTTLESQQRL